MYFSPITTRIFQRDEDLYSFILEHIPAHNQQSPFPEGSVLIISSKIVALSQGRITRTSLKKAVYTQADEIINDLGDLFLTCTNGIVIPNAGIDQSNAPDGEVILWPTDPDQVAQYIRQAIQQQYNIKDIGVIISDSRVTPRRRGTVGVAIGWSGIWGVKDERGKKDLFGRELQVSTINIADNLVSGAEVLMGQADECIPLVLVQDLSADLFTDTQQLASSAYISSSEDLFPL